MDKIKQNIDLQEAIQRYNIEKSVVGTLAYNIDQNIQKGMPVDEAINDVLQKSKKANVGDIHTWNGKKFKKQANGKWLEVSEKGKTKEEHEKLSEKYYKSPSSVGGDLGWEHSKHAKKLSDKEHSDEEVGLGGDKKEDDYDKEWVDSFLKKVKSAQTTIGRGMPDKDSRIKRVIQNMDDFPAPEKKAAIEGLNKLGYDINGNKTQKSLSQDTLSKAEQTEAQRAKIKRVMDEWKAGKLKSSSGEKVTDQKMALAIALSEAGISKED